MQHFNKTLKYLLRNSMNIKTGLAREICGGMQSLYTERAHSAMCIYISMYIDIGTHTQVQVCVDYIYYIYKANFQSSENKSYPHITAKFLHNSISTSHLV